MRDDAVEGTVRQRVKGNLHHLFVLQVDHVGLAQIGRLHVHLVGIAQQHERLPRRYQLAVTHENCANSSGKGRHDPALSHVSRGAGKLRLRGADAGVGEGDILRGGAISLSAQIRLRTGQRGPGRLYAGLRSGDPTRRHRHARPGLLDASLGYGQFLIGRPLCGDGVLCLCRLQRLRCLLQLQRFETRAANAGIAPHRVIGGLGVVEGRPGDLDARGRGCPFRHSWAT